MTESRGPGAAMRAAAGEEGEEGPRGCIDPNTPGRLPHPYICLGAEVGYGPSVAVS